MAKDFNAMLEKYMVKEVEREYNEVKNISDLFSETGEEEELRYVLSQENVEAVFKKGVIPKTDSQKKREQEQLEEYALTIQENVRKGKPENIEIRFDQGCQLSGKTKYPFGNTALLVRTKEGDTSPSLFLLKKDNTFRLRVLIGGDDAQAVMAAKDGKGGVNYISLSEIQLLSIQENPDPQKEIGLLTSYHWLTAKVYTSVILAYNLAPIKNLLLAEWLQEEWKREMNIRKYSGETAEGGANE